MITIVCVCASVLECVVRTCKIFSMHNFQACDAVFLTVVTMMYTKLSELIYLITGSLYPLTSTCPVFPAPSTSGDVHSTLFLSVRGFSGTSWGRPLLYVLCFTSSLKYVNNSI